jgi:hypothetical protein
MFTIPYVGECLRLDGEHNPNSSKRIGRILEGVQDGPFRVCKISEYLAFCLT